MDDAMITVGILTMIIAVTLIMLVINVAKIDKLTKRIDYYDKELIALKDELNQLRMAAKFNFPIY